MSLRTHSPYSVASSVAYAIHHAALRTASQMNVEPNDPRAYVLEALYEHFHLLVLDATRQVALEQVLQFAIGVGKDEHGEPTISYALLDGPTGQQATVVFPDEVVGLLEAGHPDTWNSLREALALLATGQAAQAKESLRGLVERHLRIGVRERLEQAGTALLLCRTMPVDDALREAARLASGQPSTA